MLTDPNHLWSPYGIRSLSKSHELFGKDENYWRGPIWIQMNWLGLKALKERYTVQDGAQRERAKEIYDALRKNVVDNVFNVSLVTWASTLPILDADACAGVETNGLFLGAIRRRDRRGSEKVRHPS